jgi:hypothetical protein
MRLRWWRYGQDVTVRTPGLWIWGHREPVTDEFRAKELELPHPAPIAGPSPPPRTVVGHLLIIGSRETRLYRHLQAALATDSKTVVLMDRRRTDTGAPTGVAERRQRTIVRRHLRFDLLESVYVDIVRTEVVRTPRLEEHVNNGELATIDERERVERWVEDRQYVIGRLIPGLLEDRERWRAKAEAAEQESDQLRFEITALRKEVALRESERQHIGSEQVAIAEAFRRAMEHLTQLQQPLNDVAHRLHSLQSAVVEVNGG